MGFFYYNVYGTKNKIFMGDTGSLILGTVMAVLVIQFNEFNIDQTDPFTVYAAPAVSFGILIYPLMDTLRVFTIRVLRKRSPLSADKNHTHHRLLALGMPHRQATYVILLVNALFTAAVFYLQWMGIIWLMLFNLVVGGLLLLLPSYLVGSKELIARDDPYQEVLLFSKKPANGVKNQPSSRHSPNVQLRKMKEQLQKIGLW